MSPRGPVYLDTSALIKLYLPEPGSEELERLVTGRHDLLLSDLAITEFTSAIARRKRTGELPPDRAGSHYRTLLDHALSGDYYLRSASTVDVHRLAERLLLSIDAVELRAADALHLALATASDARALATFDRRLRTAAPTLGLGLLPQ